jgi:hypothetical protein
VHAPVFGGSAANSNTGSTAGTSSMFVLHGQPSAPHTSVIGFPPAESHVAPVDPSNRTGSGALSFSGQGHAIWQDSPASTRSNAIVSRPRSESERAIFGEPSARLRPIPPHRISGPGFAQPGFFYPYYAFSPFGFYGNGFCDPFWGFDPGFGCGGLGFGFGYGFGYGGYGYGYPGNFGGYSNYGVGSYSGPADYDNSGPSDNYSNSYSPDPAALQGSDQSSQATPPPAPSATLIYLKDGTSYDVMSYWLDAGKLHYITNYGGESTIDMSQLDLQRTVDENARLGASFTLKPAPVTPAQVAPDSQTAPQP